MASDTYSSVNMSSVADQEMINNDSTEPDLSNEFSIEYSIEPRLYNDIFKQQMTERDDSMTVTDQVNVEKLILKCYETFERRASIDPELPILRRQEHIDYLNASLKYLPKSYECLDASRPWMCFWILNSLWLLNSMPNKITRSQIVTFLSKCQHADGGYGGGPDQFGHLAPTYSAINTLCIIGTKEAYDSIDRVKLNEFLWSLKTPQGGFSMHRGGEVDVRGAYCALSIARLTGLFTFELFDKTAEWIVSCQTYEGGFGGSQGMEAHGGYAFCAIAGLTILGRPYLCDFDGLLRWCANRQMKLEGGFQGRTNKLVDGCYSFWQGAAFPMIHALLAQKGMADNLETLLFNQGALQEYILICCQNPTGGLIDKPGKPRDLYHTSYVLSGLSLAQHGIQCTAEIIGDVKNELRRIHPVHCIAPQLVVNCNSYFKYANAEAAAAATAEAATAEAATAEAAAAEAAANQSA